MREVVDGVLYDTEGAQFVTGYKTRRRRRGGGDRLESGTMYVMEAGGKKRVFLVERPATGEAFAEPVDAATARVVIDEWCAAGRITSETARMALSTLDMVAPAASDAPPAQAEASPAVDGRNSVAEGRGGAGGGGGARARGGGAEEQ